MARLIASGCSNTFGEGLVDCWVEKTGSAGLEPSKFAWPELLAKHLGINEVVNLARGGSSNKTIWRNLVDFNWQEGDIAVIHWTFVDRDAFFGTRPVIGTWLADPINRQKYVKSDTKASRFYYNYLWSEEDREYDFWNRTDHVYKILKRKNIKQYHCQTSTSTHSRGFDNLPNTARVSNVTHPDLLDTFKDYFLQPTDKGPIDTRYTNYTIKKYQPGRPEWAEVEFLPYSIIDEDIFIDLAEDADHPGPETHKLLADKIYNYIR